MHVNCPAVPAWRPTDNLQCHFEKGYFTSFETGALIGLMLT